MGNSLVTGGLGFIGSHLVRRLVAEKERVKVLDNGWRFGKRNLEDISDEVEIIDGDIRDFDVVKKAVKDVDTVYHLAAIVNTQHFHSHPWLVLDVGITGTSNVLKAIEGNCIKRFLYLSSTEVYGNPSIFPTPETHPLMIIDSKNSRVSYPSSKLIGETLCSAYAKKNSFDLTIVRLENPYGPRMGWSHVIAEFIKRIILNEQFTIQGDGMQTRSFCYINDAVDGIIKAATIDEGRNEIFNIGSDEGEISLNQIANHLKEICGKDFGIKYLPNISGTINRRWPNISKAQTILNYKPKIKIEEGLRRTFDWYRKEIHWWLKNGKSGEYPWEPRKTD